MVDDETNAVVTIIAQCRSRAGAGDEVASLLAAHAAASRAETGCVSFRAYRDAADPDRFALHEQYADEQALQEHRRSAHFARYFTGGIIPLLLERAWSRYAEIPAAGAVRRERFR
jgi:(4S)-4-hydroxy-5-phosphonooxypentane-2,3-dione isomerase